MPTPKKGESRDDYMSRCMGDDKMNDEFGNPRQRAAVCNSYFEERKAETIEALQYGRPGKNDPRKTPAKPSERRKGSKKNKPGSAKKPNKSISMSKATESRLRKMMQEHNKKVAAKGKGSKATMGRLKSVFRRGAGAFSRSHAPNMSRTGWGIARVKAFLYLLRNGRPSNPNYKQDNDLLPRGHPRAKKADEDYEDWDEEPFTAAEYQGRKVNLNKPFRTPKGPKKFAVYVKNEKGTVVIVRFGDPNMEIKRDDPERRRNFRSRHNCDSPGPKTKARYWSCKMWERDKSVSDYTSEEDFNKTDTSLEADMGGLIGCGCDDCEEKLEQETQKAESDCGCGGHVQAAEPKPKSTETHDEYMSRCMKMGYTRDECMKAHEGHKFKDQSKSHDGTDHYKAEEGEEEFYAEFYAGMEDYIFRTEEAARKKSQEIGLGDNFHTSKTADGTTLYIPGKDEETFQKWFDKNDSHDSVDVEGYGRSGGSYSKQKVKRNGCREGYVKRDGECVKVSWTLDVDISVDETIIEANTGRQVVRISGVAFHEGVNRNGWEITRAGANLAVSQMVNSDLTLNHPPAEKGRFKRNMDGGVNDAVVGIITEASITDKAGGEWDVAFKADVYRTELFEALESGLWLRKGYGVSIGGTGIPDEMIEAEDGRMIMKFETDFVFDHLAIVHRPAYERATIDMVEKIEISAENVEAFISQTEYGNNQQKVNSMSEHEIIEASEEVVETPDYAAEIEALKASLAEREAELNEIKAAEEAKAEEARLALVEKATEMGIAGVSDLPSETISTIIASFEAKVVVEEEVVMEPVKASETAVVAPKSDAVVANFLNGRKLATPEEIYEKGFNVWANAWNKTVSEAHMRSPLYAEAKEKNYI